MVYFIEPSFWFPTGSESFFIIPLVIALKNCLVSSLILSGFSLYVKYAFKTGYSSSGLQKDSSGYLKISPATSDNIKAGTEVYRPIVPYHQHESIFYGLAKVAGVDMEQVAPVQAACDTFKKIVDELEKFI